MPFEKGKSGNPKGREKGSKNKFTSLKQAFLDAFEGLGGAEELERWASESKANQRVFYQMVTKMLPSNVSAELSGDLAVEIKRTITSERPKD